MKDTGVKKRILVYVGVPRDRHTSFHSQWTDCLYEGTELHSRHVKRKKKRQ